MSHPNTRNLVPREIINERTFQEKLLAITFYTILSNTEPLIKEARCHPCIWEEGRTEYPGVRWG